MIAIAVALVYLLAVTPAHGGEVYKCTNAAGKIEYRDTPCEKSAGQKVDVKINSIDARPNPDLAAKAAEMDKRVAERMRGQASANEQRAVADARKDRFCQDQRDQITRQRAWLHSVSAAARESAQAEIDIARRRMAESDCR